MSTNETKTPNYKQDFILSPYWELCYRAHSNTSFYPERRADSYVKDYSNLLNEDLAELGEKAGNYKEKFIAKFTAWMSSKGNCISSMITGGSNFPVRRAEKANRAESNKYEEFNNWRNRYFKAVNRERTPSPEEDLDNALASLDKLVIMQGLMKEANKIIRRELKKETKHSLIIGMLKEVGLSEKLASEAMIKNYNGYGFPSYMLTNRNAKIKREREKIITMKNRIATKASWEDIKFDGGYITVEDDRVKIFHDEKPEKEIIQNLKSNGFRWSPNWSCWCRKHTTNAVNAAKSICY